MPQTKVLGEELMVPRDAVPDFVNVSVESVEPIVSKSTPVLFALLGSMMPPVGTEVMVLVTEPGPEPATTLTLMRYCRDELLPKDCVCTKLPVPDVPADDEQVEVLPDFKRHQLTTVSCGGAFQVVNTLTVFADGLVTVAMYVTPVWPQVSA